MRERLLVALVAALFLHLNFFRAGTPIFPFTAGSHGVFFDEADRVVRGEVMYRDFFEFLAPGTTYLTALLQLVVGPSMRGLGYALVVLGSLLAVLMHTLASRMVGGRWRLLPPAAFVGLVYAPGPLGDHKWPALCCGLLGLIILGSGPLTTGRARTGGLFLGSAAVFTQDLALGLSAGVLLHLALRRTPPRIVLAMSSGIVVVPALVIGFFAWKAGLDTVIYDWVVFPLQRYPGMNFGLVDRTLSLRALPRELAQWCLAAAGVAAALWVLWRKAPAGGGVDSARLAASAGLGMFVVMAHRALFPTGMAVQSSVLLPVLACALERRGDASRGRGRWLDRAVLGVVAVGFLHGSAVAVWRQLFQAFTLEEHRAGRVWVSTPMPELSWIERNTRPGEGTFLYPARGGQYFLSRTRNVTSMPYLIEGQNTPEQARRALAEIEAARPAVGLWDARPWPTLPAGQAGPLAPLYEGIVRSYDAETLPSGVLLLRRRNRAPATEAPVASGGGASP